MLALREYRRSRCPNCGGNINVTAAPENEDKFRHLPPVQCFRCVGIAQSHEAYRDQPHPQTLLHLVPQRPVR